MSAGYVVTFLPNSQAWDFLANYVVKCCQPVYYVHVPVGIPLASRRGTLSGKL